MYKCVSCGKPYFPDNKKRMCRRCIIDEAVGGAS